MTALLFWYKLYGYVQGWFCQVDKFHERVRFESDIEQKLAKLMKSPQNLNSLGLGATMKF